MEHNISALDETLLQVTIGLRGDTFRDPIQATNGLRGDTNNISALYETLYRQLTA